jgi:phosphoribosylanthranilate isomerase
VTRVKVCGLTNEADAIVAIEAGAHAIGFVLEPTSPRCISVDDFKWIQSLPDSAVKVAVFGVYSGDELSCFDAVQATVFQVVPPDLPRIQVVHLPCSEVFSADALLIDSKAAGQFGGTGIVADWDAAADFITKQTHPVIVAGGLNPENVTDCIRATRPYAVDASSGLEDHGKVREFVTRVLEYLE